MKSEEILHEEVARYIRFLYPKVIFNSDMSGVKLTMFQGQPFRYPVWLTQKLGKCYIHHCEK